MFPLQDLTHRSADDLSHIGSIHPTSLSGNTLETQGHCLYPMITRKSLLVFETRMPNIMKVYFYKSKKKAHLSTGAPNSQKRFVSGAILSASSFFKQATERAMRLNKCAWSFNHDTVTTDLFCAFMRHSLKSKLKHLWLFSQNPHEKHMGTQTH